jgi:hypothetical protein
LLGRPSSEKSWICSTTRSPCAASSRITLGKKDVLGEGRIVEMPEIGRSSQGGDGFLLQFLGEALGDDGAAAAPVVERRDHPHAVLSRTRQGRLAREDHDLVALAREHIAGRLDHPGDPSPPQMVVHHRDLSLFPTGHDVRDIRAR